MAAGSNRTMRWGWVHRWPCGRVSARLQITKMMRVRRPATADEAWLLGDRAKVLPVAITSWCGNSEGALVDARRLPWVCGFGSNLNFGITIVRNDFRWRKLREPAFEAILHELGISCREAVLDGERLAGPRRRDIRRRNAPNLEQQLFTQCRRLISIEDGRTLAV